LFAEVHAEISSLPLSLLHWAFSNSTPQPCVIFQFLVSYLVFGVFFGGCHSAKGAMLVYPRGGWRNTV
jgi:hypothetical protein